MLFCQQQNSDCNEFIIKYYILLLQEQYIFVYDALLEALKAGNTAIPCSEFQLRFDDLCQVDPAKGKSKLQEQFEVRVVI